MTCHACGHEEEGTFAFCPNCGTRPLTAPAADDSKAAEAAWKANPRVAADHRATMAMDSVSAPPAGLVEPAPPKAGGGNVMMIVIGVAVLAGIGVAIYFLANF